MRVILDTNVLVAALIAPQGPPHHLFEAFLGDRFTLITGDRQIEEFSRVTRYPAIRRRIHPAQAGRMLNAIRSLAVYLESLPVPSVSRDPHDDYLFAMAQAGAADYLVTGDKADVLALVRYGRTQIVTVRKLMAILQR
ncbi:MAG: putative toxin-antitoxin system toxin component, PIN family [Acidiferrobacteraceae bacterium]